MGTVRAWLRPPGFRRQFLVALFLVALVAGCYHFVDRPAAIWAHGLPPRIVGGFHAVTFLGGSRPYLAGLAFLYPALRFWRRRPAQAQRALFVFAAVAATGLAVNVAKTAAGRWRPTALFADDPQYGFTFFEYRYDRSSFPSGHAATAGALACALTLLFPRLRVLWIGAAAVVAASRVIIGAHYPGDVLAGLWVGFVISLQLSRADWFRAVLETSGGRPRANEVSPASPGARAAAS